jgi:hypothetical protein
MSLRSRSLVTLAVALAIECAPHALGAKDTVKLTVSSAALRQPIEIVDPAVLTISNIYDGEFVGGIAAEPDRDWPRYIVVFDLQTLDGVKGAAYTVSYSRNRWTGEGFVYLPGHGDASYPGNAGTIIRDESDGRWHRASDAWAEALNARLP